MEALVSKCTNRQVPSVGFNTPISTLQDALRKSPAAVVVDEDKKPVSIMTRIDLLDFLTEENKG
jgi:predicted transcriptional regulator